MRILAIDYGLRRIGLATTNGVLPYPWGVIVNNIKGIKTINTLCKTHQIEKLVIGLPEGKLASKVKNFGQSLSQKTSLPVEFQDETLTTQESIAKMVEAGKKRKVRKQKQDAFAAALILQKYLQKNV